MGARWSILSKNASNENDHTDYHFFESENLLPKHDSQSERADEIILKVTFESKKTLPPSSTQQNKTKALKGSKSCKVCHS